MVSICTLRVRLFLKSFSPKPACLVATENKIFRISSSCWPKFTPLTRKWIYTLIFTSIHFWKKGEREREREREPRSESTDRRAARSSDVGARRSTSGVIVQRARSSIVTARRSARSRSTAATIVERCNRDLDDRGAITPSFFLGLSGLSFLTSSPNTRKYFSENFLKCNQTHENIFLSGK